MLLKLEGDPPMAVRESVRDERERLVRQPMVALMQDLADADACYRKFVVPSLGLTLWPWQRQVGFVRAERNFDQRVWLDLDGMYVEACWWMFNPGSYTSPWREAYMTAVADDTSGPELVGIVETLRQQGYDLGGEQLERIPKSYPGDHPRALLLRDADHPRAGLLRHRSLVAGRHLGSENWLHKPEAADRVLAAFEELRPMASWFADHVPGDAHRYPS